MIGERRESGGGNINAYQTCEKALCYYTPYSVPDGSSPFQVYMLRVGQLNKGQEISDVLVPDNEFEFHLEPHSVYLAGETGYLTKELFKRIMDEFTKWWRATSARSSLLPHG